MSEKPEHQRTRRLADWINPTGARKAHSLIDKVYKRKMAREKVKANKGAGGIDDESIEAFGAQLQERLGQLHNDLKTDCYRPLPVRQELIPKAGQPNEHRTLGIPAIIDRVCQQALVNRLQPIIEPVFDAANFGYRQPPKIVEPVDQFLGHHIYDEIAEYLNAQGLHPGGAGWPGKGDLRFTNLKVRYLANTYGLRPPATIGFETEEC